MGLVRHKHLIADVSTIAGYFKTDVEKILNVYFAIVKKAIEEGEVVGIGDIGRIKQRKVAGRKELDNAVLNPSTQEMGYRAATPSYMKPHMTFNKNIKSAVKEKTVEKL